MSIHEFAHRTLWLLVIADQCDSNPCQNNSICVGGKCECLPGYSGENCKEGKSVIIKRINEWETWIDVHRGL